eukprot:SAG11_NODE_13_length_26388_cov_67.360341_27_plen_107_part_00
MRAASADVAAAGSGGAADDDGQVDTFIPGQGPLSVTVPGAVQGFCDLHARYGKLPWRELFGPAIEYALRGKRVLPYAFERFAWRVKLRFESPVPKYLTVRIMQALR